MSGGAPGGRCGGELGAAPAPRREREEEEGEKRGRGLWGRQPPGSGRAGRPSHLNATPGASASR